MDGHSNDCFIGSSGNYFQKSPVWQIALYLSICMVLMSGGLSFYMIQRHLRNYTTPRIQRYIIRVKDINEILLMVPLYSICALLAFVYINEAVYITIIRDIYEGYVVFNFLLLFLEYLGISENERLERLHAVENIAMPPPWFVLLNRCCFYYSPSSPTFLLKCRVGVLQFFVTRSFITALSLWLEYFHLLCHGSMSPEYGYVYMTVINSISMGLAMLSLIMYYLSCRHVK